MPAIKKAVYRTGSDQPIFNVQTMQQIVSESMSAQRFPMILLGAFAGLALLLASVGIYGVISYSVAQRFMRLGYVWRLVRRSTMFFGWWWGKGLPWLSRASPSVWLPR